MSGSRALLVRCAEADDGSTADETGPRVGRGFGDGAAAVVGIQAVAFAKGPLRGLVARDHILISQQLGRAVDRDAVFVPKDDQPAELKRSGKADRGVVDALHQAAVTGNDEGAVIDEIVAID